MSTEDLAEMISQIPALREMLEGREQEFEKLSKKRENLKKTVIELFNFRQK
jgi:arsenate reductase-like glutaredoxin family protein